MNLPNTWPWSLFQDATFFQLRTITSLRWSILVVLLFLLTGCARNVPSKKEQARETAQEYGDLRLTLQTNEPKLQEQLTWVESSQALPANLRATMTANAQTDVGVTHDGCAIIREALKLKSLEHLLSETNNLMPGLTFDFSPVELEKARSLLEKHAEAKLTARESLSSPWNTQWEIEEGFLADLSWADAALIIARLELLQAATDIQDGNTSQAIESIQYSLEFSHRLNQATHPYARRVAAETRSAAFLAIQNLMMTREIELQQLTALRDTLMQHLDQWPQDADVWIADRACGLHFYEMVRDGELRSLLTEEEIKTLSEAEELDSTIKAIARNLNRDELFYLTEMRQTIEACQKPYYQRIDMFLDQSDRLIELENTFKYPILAGKYLMKDQRQQHALQAQDLTRNLAWVVALQMAVEEDFDESSLPLNPMVGKPFEVSVESNRIMINNVVPRGSSKQIIVPRLAGK